MPTRLLPGTGDEPPEDRALHPGRSGTRESGLVEEYGEHMGVKTHIKEFQPLDPRFPNRVAQGPTRFTWEVGERAEEGQHSNVFAKGRGGGVSNLRRAQAATRSAARRLVEGRNLYSGQPE